MTKKKLRRKVKSLRRQNESLADRLLVCQRGAVTARETIERQQKQLLRIDDVLNGGRDQ